MLTALETSLKEGTCFNGKLFNHDAIFMAIADVVMRILQNVSDFPTKSRINESASSSFHAFLLKMFPLLLRSREHQPKKRPSCSR